MWVSAARLGYVLHSAACQEWCLVHPLVHLSSAKRTTHQSSRCSLFDAYGLSLPLMHLHVKQ